MRFAGSRDPRHHATFAQAVLRTAAPDGGLWVPDPVACFRDMGPLLERPFQERSREILQRLLGDEFERAALERVAEALDLPAPVFELRRRIFVMELFHGPSLAFKDFGARFLASVLTHLLPADRPRTVLAATSGDTGAAAALAFWRRPGFRVAVLYPRGRVSPLQERQFASLGENVRAFAVEGSFDDCHAMVRACLGDPRAAAELGAVGANSLNVARLLAQVLYFFEAVARVQERCFNDPPVVAVPCGNFGNLFAGLWARRMGLPVKALVAATNANRTVPRFLETGGWSPEPPVATLSSAMDVGEPSNWERVRALFRTDLDTALLSEQAALRKALRWGSLGDGETRAALRELHALGYTADPHGAVAYGVLQQRMGLNESGVFLATAHPAKFKPLMDELGFEVEVPPALAALQERPLHAEVLPPDPAALREALR